ncbi:hypothetical protein SAMN05445756_1246 [Kytococcus aerolatus]|uniref:Uncharacterized protein n=1 Tax=Kytococcus aerolatus TaxID=592308 RepID=A0A212TGC6_9MICO|nr:hypothetical protein SAMN05445756_1246 [Kytococcus aerolatus]
MPRHRTTPRTPLVRRLHVDLMRTHTSACR